MEKLTKVLLVICSVLIIVLILTTGLLLGNFFNSPIKINQTNNTTVNNTTLNTTDVNKTKSLLSAAEAEQIVKEQLPFKITKNTSFVTVFREDEGRQQWFVRVINNGYLVGTYYVDAETGEIATGS